MADIEIEQEITVTKKLYGWTKWGGANDGMIKKDLDEWYCQSCSEKQTKGMPQYMIAIEKSMRDYVRVCSKCRNLARKKSVTLFNQLLSLTRRPDGLEDWFQRNLANLPTTSSIL